MQEDEPATFYLTDFLARHFDALVVRGLGLDRHPELLPTDLRQLPRLVYLAQTDDAALRGRAPRRRPTPRARVRAACAPATASCARRSTAFVGTARTLACLS